MPGRVPPHQRCTWSGLRERRLTRSVHTTARGAQCQLNAIDREMPALTQGNKAIYDLAALSSADLLECQNAREHLAARTEAEIEDEPETSEDGTCVAGDEKAEAGKVSYAGMQQRRFADEH